MDDVRGGFLRLKSGRGRVDRVLSGKKPTLLDF